ncbi:MAG TPA: hypothetical protein VH251_04060 [Verrucomicrobiae bacterium]|nr:hypothetical protein [Verrucomicrobiae bacterium]
MVIPAGMVVAQWLALVVRRTAAEPMTLSFAAALLDVAVFPVEAVEGLWWWRRSQV